jgi:uncharacterized protein (DUF433 family)
MISNLATKHSKKQSSGFYTTTEASHITQVPLWTMNSWKNNGIIIPSVKWIDETDKIQLGHSFETVIYIRLLRLIREKGISLYNAVVAIKRIKDRFGYPGKNWAEAKIFSDGQDVYVYDNRDSYETTDLSKRNQKVAEMIFGDEFIGLRERADALLIPQQFMNYVEIDPAIQNGLPIIANTTMRTAVIHNLYSQNYSYSDINEMYPFIPIDKIIGAEDYETFLDNKGKISLN